MTIGFRVLALCVLVLVEILAGAAARADTVLPVGGRVQDVLAATPWKQQTQYYAACAAIATKPGQTLRLQWRVEVGSGGLLIVSSGCQALLDSGAILLRNPMAETTGKGVAGKMEFTAGGGRYSIRVMGTKPQSPFTLQLFEVKAPTAPTLPAGIPVMTAERGWASQGGAVGSARHPAGQTFRDCPTCPELVALPPESFRRSLQTGGAQLVTFARAFAMGASEVTFAEWDACVAAGGCSAPLSDGGWGRGSMPAIYVAYPDAQQYVTWLSRTTGQDYFLPTEAEWEYAARAGTDTAWYTGAALLAEDANILNMMGRTVPVRSYAPNGFGLYDMYGNVAEWTQDCVNPLFPGTPRDGAPDRSGACSGRVLRGGAFLAEPENASSSARADSGSADLRASTIGFRVARAL